MQVNVGASAGQTVFHLHWHVLGRRQSTGSSCRAGTEVTEL